MFCILIYVGLKEYSLDVLNNTVNRDAMNVTIDNVKYSRYQGELAIILKTMESDDRVNVVGESVDCYDLVQLFNNKKFTYINLKVVN